MHISTNTAECLVMHFTDIVEEVWVTNTIFAFHVQVGKYKLPVCTYMNHSWILLALLCGMANLCSTGLAVERQWLSVEGSHIQFLRNESHALNNDVSKTFCHLFSQNVIYDCTSCSHLLIISTFLFSSHSSHLPLSHVCVTIGYKLVDAPLHTSIFNISHMVFLPNFQMWFFYLVHCKIAFSADH